MELRSKIKSVRRAWILDHWNLPYYSNGGQNGPERPLGQVLDEDEGHEGRDHDKVELLETY